MKISKEKLWQRMVIAILGILLLAGGIWQGEYGVTLNKAVHICLECIGIG